MTQKIWIITDTHLGHDNMVKYCARPENHSELILENLKKNIAAYDILIHLGDICIGRDEEWHAKLFEALPFKGTYVKKILLRGNHDKKSDTWYLEHGWDIVAEKIENIYFGKRVMLSHTPAPRGEYDINLHGHFHNSLPRLLRKDWVTADEEERNKKDLGNLNPKSKLLAIEYTNYKPVLLSSLL